METSDLNCPVCLGKLTEPVIASDGITYDLSCIQLWYRYNYTSPFTKNKISNLVYRNKIICNILDIPLPINEVFDMKTDKKWNSDTTETSEDEIDLDQYDIEESDDKSPAEKEYITRGILTIFTLLVVLGSIFYILCKSTLFFGILITIVIFLLVDSNILRIPLILFSLYLIS